MLYWCEKYVSQTTQSPQEHIFLMKLIFGMHFLSILSKSLEEGLDKLHLNCCRKNFLAIFLIFVMKLFGKNIFGGQTSAKKL